MADENRIGPFFPAEDETLDDLIIQGMTLLQAKNGYRFSIDSVLLAMWLELSQVETGMDLGTGSGVIALLLAARKETLRLDGLELQESLFLRAQRNVVNNRLTERIRIVQGDILQVSQLFPKNSYDLVCSNPPFFRAGEGKVCPQSEKAIARHELRVTLTDLLQAAQYLLRPGKKLALILNAARLSELIALLPQYGFALCRLRLVHPRPQAAATMFLAEAAKKAKSQLTIEPPLFVYQADGSYSEEILSWYEQKESSGR